MSKPFSIICKLGWNYFFFKRLPQYNDLMRKKRIVENDKAKIEKVIKELDEKKKEALRQAWEQVRNDCKLDCYF